MCCVVCLSKVPNIGSERTSFEKFFHSPPYPRHLAEHEDPVPSCLELRQHPIQQLELPRAPDQVLTTLLLWVRCLGISTNTSESSPDGHLACDQKLAVCVQQIPCYSIFAASLVEIYLETLQRVNVHSKLTIERQPRYCCSPYNLSDMANVVVAYLPVPYFSRRPVHSKGRQGWHTQKLRAETNKPQKN